MPKDIQSGIASLSIQEKETRPKKAKKVKKARPPQYLYEEWAYGYHLKNRHLRILAEKYNLPWQRNPMRVMFRLSDFFRRATQVDFRTTPIVYRGEAAQIITFLRDDGRKRLELNTFSGEDMEKIRDIIGIPAGTKPKWFEAGDNDSNADFSSEDEDFPHIDMPVTMKYPEEEYPKEEYQGECSCDECQNASDDSHSQSSDWSSDEDEESDTPSERDTGRVE